MMDRPTDPEPSPHLTAASFHILLALGEGERHGYGIMQDVAAFTVGQFHIGPGTLYRSLRHLLKTGLIVETTGDDAEVIDDERRRYYALTPTGRKATSDELRRFERLVRIGLERNLRE